MARTTKPIEGAPGFRVEVQLRPAVELSDAEFFDLCRTNRDLRLERTAEGAIVTMPPAVELRPPSDRLADAQARVEEHVANGARLGWLFDPATESGHVCRPGQAGAHVAHAARIAGDPELPGFVLDLDALWRPGP